MAAPTRLVALLLTLPFVLSACGQTAKNSAGSFQGEQKNVAQTVEDLQTSSRKGDTGKICSELLAPSLVGKITQASKGTCDKVLKDRLSDADAFELQVQKVTITGATATALVKSEGGKTNRVDTLTLQRVGNAWKIASLVA
jgi:Putative lumazine-binding